VLAALRVGGVLSCASAAQALSLPLLVPPVRTHVVVPRDHHTRSGMDIVMHRRSVLIDGFTTSLAQTGADCARCLPFVEAVVVLDALLAQGVAAEDVLALLRSRGAPAARTAVLAADARAGSSGESVFRVAAAAAGVHAVPQVYIPRVGRVDFLIDGWLVVEIDGLQYHNDGKAFANDRRRDAELALQGYRVLRFTWVDVVNRTSWVVETVLSVLASRAA